MADYRDPNHIDPNGNFSITQLVKFIREKVFGIDVREAIAKALERVYEDASKDGNANMEVSQARGLFGLLKDRLDNSDTRVAQKADRTYVDAVLSSIATGGPKELFYSLNALETKYPNGAEGTFLVFGSEYQDGAHVFIWKDSEWEDLGEYGNYISQEDLIENFIKNANFANGKLEPMKFIGTSQGNITTARGNKWAKIVDSDADYSGMYYEFDTRSGEYFGLGLDTLKLSFDILAAVPGKYYAQISYLDSPDSTEVKFQNFKQLNLMANQETSFSCDIKLGKYTEGNPVIRLKIVHNKVDQINKTTDFLVRKMVLKNSVTTIESQSAYIVSKSNIAVPLQNNLINISEFLNTQYYRVESSTTSGNVGVRWIVNNNPSDFNHSNINELTTNIQNLSSHTVEVVFGWQGVKLDGRLVEQKDLARVYIDDEKMYTWNLRFKVPQRDYVQSNYYIYCRNTGTESLLIDTETTIKRLYKEVNESPSIFGNYVSNNFLTNGARNNNLEQDIIHKDGADWIRLYGNESTDAPKGFMFPVVDYLNTSKTDKLKIHLDLFTEYERAFGIRMLYLDNNKRLLYQDDVYYCLNMLANTRRKIEVSYSLKDVENAVQCWLLVAQETGGATNFRLANVYGKSIIANDDSHEFSNGNFLYNYSAIGDVAVNNSQSRGANWLQVQSINPPAENAFQGIKFPINLDRSIKGYKIKIKASVWSLVADNFDFYIQYINADNTEERRELLGNLNVPANSLWDKEFVYRINADSTAVTAYLIIVHTDNIAPRFMVKGIEISPFSESSNSEFSAHANHLPVLNIVGDMSGMDKDTRKDVRIEYTQAGIKHTYFSDCKWQGDSSLQWAKKNYRLRFYEDSAKKNKLKLGFLPLDEDTNQINLKADWNDWTHANNVLISRYIGNLSLATADKLPENLVNAYNQEQVTGLPLVVYINGNFEGLYTMSTKKGDKLLNSDEDNPLHAVIQAAENTNATKFKSDTALVDTTDYEMATPDDLDPNILTNFNSLLALVNSADDSTFTSEIGQRINLQTVANWIVSVMYFRLRDNVYKNICYQTTDGGDTWYMVDYDHDQAYGMFWDRSVWYEYDDFKLEDMMENHKLVQRLLELGLIQNELLEAYQKLSEICPAIKIINDYKQWIDSIGMMAIEENFNRWPTQAGKDYFDLQKLFNWIVKRTKLVESMFETHYLDGLKKD